MKLVVGAVAIKWVVVEEGRDAAIERAAGNELIAPREADHPVYDCLYLACAEQEDVELLTADRRLANKMPRARISLLTQAAP